MNKLSKNPIDQYFKETLDSPDLKYNKQDWKGLEARLPRKSKRKVIAWLLPLAAALLIFVSLWISEVPLNENNSLSKSDTAKGVSDNSTSLTQVPEPPAQDIPSGNSNVPLHSEAQTNFDYLKRSPRNKYIAVPTSAVATASNARQPVANPAVLIGVMPGNRELSSPEISGLSVAPTPTAMESDIEEISADPNGEISADPNGNTRLSLALSISPDINSVSHFSNSNFGMSIGLGAIYKITPHLSIMTAIGYSKKEYSAMPYEYKAPWASSNVAKYAKSIDADCRVLDVPLTLNYTFRTSQKQAFFASAGLSSYFMLEEHYTVKGSGQSGYPPKTDPSYSYKNDNNHLFSVVNLSVGMSTPLNKNTSIVLEPYVKLPYTGIGQGKVNLQSAGVNFQLQFNFPRKIKPGSSLSVAR